MKAAGYRLNGYNATYEKTLFEVFDKSSADSKSRVLEITDVNSGTTFIFPYDLKVRMVPAKDD